MKVNLQKVRVVSIENPHRLLKTVIKLVCPTSSGYRTISQVNIGLYVSKRLATPLSYVFPVFSYIPLEIIIPAVVGGLLICALVICCVVFRYQRKLRSIKYGQDWMNTITELELSNLRHKSMQRTY